MVRISEMPEFMEVIIAKNPNTWLWNVYINNGDTDKNVTLKSVTLKVAIEFLQVTMDKNTLGKTEEEVGAGLSALFD